MATASGYIVADNERIIWGCGPTVDAAWTSAREAFGNAGITILDDEEDAYNHPGSWTRQSGLRVWPATQALLSMVQTDGGNIAWTRHVSGVACTPVEEMEG